MLLYNQKEGNKNPNKRKKEVTKMKKRVEKIIKKFNDWKENELIHKEWESEDYDNVTVYEDVEGDIICIERDANGNIVEAWEE
jgi:hypothetical protein